MRGLRGLVVGKRRDPEGKRGVGGAEACSRKPGVGALCRETGCEREERYVVSSPMTGSNNIQPVGVVRGLTHEAGAEGLSGEEQRGQSKEEGAGCCEPETAAPRVARWQQGAPCGGEEGLLL